MENSTYNLPQASLKLLMKPHSELSILQAPLPLSTVCATLGLLARELDGKLLEEWLCEIKDFRVATESRLGMPEPNISSRNHVFARLEG